MTNPIWLFAHYGRACSGCGKGIHKGDRIMTQDKATYCASCGEQATANYTTDLLGRQQVQTMFGEGRE